jgi:hypothetical protein
MIFGTPKPGQAPVVKRFEFNSLYNKWTPESRSANALEHIAYSLGRIEMHLDALARTSTTASVKPSEPNGEE